MEKIESLSYIFGRCHDIIAQIEQLHSMKDLSQGIMRINNTLSTHVEQSQLNFSHMSTQIKKFQEET